MAFLVFQRQHSSLCTGQWSALFGNCSPVQRFHEFYKIPGMNGWVPTARGFGQLLNFNCAIIVLPMCRKVDTCTLHTVLCLCAAVASWILQDNPGPKVYTFRRINQLSQADRICHSRWYTACSFAVHQANNAQLPSGIPWRTSAITVPWMSRLLIFFSGPTQA